MIIKGDKKEIIKMMSNRFNGYTYFVSINVSKGISKETAKRMWEMMNDEEKKKFTENAKNFNQQNVNGEEMNTQREEEEKFKKKMEEKDGEFRGFFSETKKEEKKKEMLERRGLRTEEKKNRGGEWINEAPFILSLSSISYNLESQSNDDSFSLNNL